MSETKQESEIVEQAIRCLQAGDALAAEQLVAEAAARALEEHGAGSPQHAAAQFDLAKVLVGIGDLRRASAALREACALQGTSEQTTRVRLTYIMNLGEILQRLGEMEEAEELLREALLDRAACYGEEHPGYAFGLEPLAEVLRRRGQLDEAMESIDEAVRILASCKHPRLAVALACRAGIAKARGEQPFVSLDQLPRETLQALLEEVLGRAEVEEPHLQLSLLLELRQALAAAGEHDPAWLLLLASASSTAARAAGDVEARLEALHGLVEAQSAQGGGPPLVTALLGLALAEDESGQHEAAERSYRQALETAEPLGDPVLRSRALRNFGLFLAERHRPAEAGELLEGALVDARTSGDGEATGRTLVSLGIFRQHEGSLEDARSLLEEALALLDPSHPDTLYARSHLEALDSGAPCGCGDPGSAIGEALREAVLSQCPADLVQTIEVVMVPGQEPRFEVALAREPEPGEMEELERVVQQATVELQRRLRERGLGG